MIRVMIVSDHPVSALGLYTLMNQQNDIEVVGQLPSVIEILEEITKTQPDVLILDCYLINNYAEHLTREVMNLGLPVKIMVIIPIIDEIHLRSLLGAGVSGYILSNEPLDAIANTVRAVLKGEMRLSSMLVKKVFDQDTRNIDYGKDLTRREKEVLALIVHGYSNAQIGEKLSIAMGTVKNHSKKIYEKLGVHNRVEAMLLALQYGLVEQNNNKYLYLPETSTG
jgi:DNA-binding NarL/FixJ family response regulator